MKNDEQNIHHLWAEQLSELEDLTFRNKKRKTTGHEQIIKPSTIAERPNNSKTAAT